MFKDIEAFKRESYGRHKSERMLDNNLYKFHKKVVKEKLEKNSTIENPLIKKEEDDSNKIKKEENDNSKKRELDISSALNKILPYLDTKFCKSLKMISKLFKIGIKNFDEKMTIGILLELYNRIDMLELEEDYENFKGIFFFL